MNDPKADNLTPGDRAKRAAAAAALELVKPGMKLGLGTGSTAAWLVTLLGERAAREDLDLFCVPTSSRTREQAQGCGLRVGTLDEAGRLDLTIDGADEFDGALNLIKGGGGALLQEKIVAAGSAEMVVIADPGKEVATLGAFPLPVEVVRFAYRTTEAIIAEHLADADVAGREITLRMAGAEPFVTDEGHYILDLHLGRIGDAPGLAAALTAIPGVVESGLFINLASRVIVGREDGSADLITRG